MNVDRATFSAHMTITRAADSEGRHSPGPVHNNCAPQGWGSDDKREHRAAASWNTIFDLIQGHLAHITGFIV